MGNEAEEREKEEALRRKLQLRREDVFALVKDLSTEEASVVLTSAMNEYLLPSPLVARFVLRWTGARE